MRYLLDTTFLIDYMRANPAAVARFRTFFEQNDRVFINEIVVCELAAGISDPQLAEAITLLRPLEFVQPGPDTALLAGKWRHDSRRAGANLSLADALVAAAADAMEAAVLTRNVRDFALTPVRVETY